MNEGSFREDLEIKGYSYSGHWRIGLFEILAIGNVGQMNGMNGMNVSIKGPDKEGVQKLAALMPVLLKASEKADRGEKLLVLAHK